MVKKLSLDVFNGEFSQIENVDVGMNIDVETHPVRSFTPYNF